MGGSRRPSPGAERCFVWLRDRDGVLLHGLPVDPRGDIREQAARAWLHVLRHPLGQALLSESAVFYVFADGYRESIALSRLHDWLTSSGSPREQSLKHDLREALTLVNQAKSA